VGIDTLGTMTATEAVQAIARGELGSEELLDAQLARIDTWNGGRNGGLNAVVALDVERARERCRAADEARARGESWGLLHGLPMTIKDSYETEGLVTTSGAPELAGHVPATDADSVAMLKRAGAIVFGKTNLPLYAGDIQTFNDVYGLTRNPWHPERTVGGSSGGAAAAVAAGFSLLELGSDIGGSIRCPAHYCGIAGIKPTWWVISKRGHIPGPPGLLRHLDLTVAGPMARSIADLELGMDVLTADGVHGVPGASLPPASPAVASLEGCRVGLWIDDPIGPVSLDVRAAIEELGQQLESAGAIVRTDVRPTTSSDEWFALYYELLLANMAGGLSPETRDFLAAVAASGDPTSLDPAMAAARGASMSHLDWMRADERRFHLMAEWDRVFDEVDVMLAPPAPVPAFPHDETPLTERTLEVDGERVPALMHLVWAGLATLPYLPGTVVPIARSSEGLPIGVQIIGPRWGDRTTLAFGRHVEQLTGGFVPPPGYE
jgi:amidase